ncbi:MAG: transposase, partial [Gammaproteobacteria bacterium]|nr:transposase [Gammaproteobacteria bacterium]
MKLFYSVCPHSFTPYPHAAMGVCATLQEFNRYNLARLKVELHFPLTATLSRNFSRHFRLISVLENTPSRAASTCLELLLGTMLTRSGFVTHSWLMLNTQKHWTSYYKCLQQGQWSWLSLARAFVRIVLREVGGEIIYLAIDDTLVLRASKKAPASQIHHQHGNKPNLAQYVRGQCWVTLAQVAERATGNAIAIPLLSRLMPTAGNTGKLCAAQTLIRSVSTLLIDKTVRLLVDSWYMRGDFILAMLAKNIEVIGQVRYDTRFVRQSTCAQIQTTRTTGNVWRENDSNTRRSPQRNRNSLAAIRQTTAVALPSQGIVGTIYQWDTRAGHLVRIL